jgi:hypothetical protein
MHQLYIEALQNYLNGHEWQENIEVFVTANCRSFSNIKDFTHGNIPYVKCLITQGYTHIIKNLKHVLRRVEWN